MRSAMPASRAEHSCPGLYFCASGLPTLQGGFADGPQIFKWHSDLIEPLSLDEAYLDVTENKTGLPTATRIASTIRAQIRDELHLTAIAGVAPNKFLAKIASDWRKPDGLFIIQPNDVGAFLAPLPVGRLSGVGRVTGKKLDQLGVRTVGELRGMERLAPRSLGRYGRRLYELERGIDDSEVVPDRHTHSHNRFPLRTLLNRM